MFGKEQPLSDREKWLWLIEHAAYKDTEVSINRNRVILKRGQLSYSIRYLSKAWLVSERSVRTFLLHAKKWQAIDTQNDTGQLVITICNYSQYQNSDTQNDTAPDEKTTSPRHRTDTNKKEDINKYKINNNIPPISPVEGEKPKRLPRGQHFSVWLENQKRIDPDISLEACPDDFYDVAEKLEKKDVVIREWAKFHDYWIAKTGEKSIKSDWLATWRNWLRSEYNG